MAELGWQAWYTLGVLGVMMVAFVREVARPDLVMLGSLGLLLVAGVVTPENAFAGFSNSAVLTVAALFVAAAGLQQTGALAFLDGLLFARTKRLIFALPRLMLSTAFLSAFLNNTPIVAMFTPRVQQWAREIGMPVSKLLIPLSYAAIVGGMVTLIGTSTNIVVSGLLEAEGYPPLGLFDLSWIGIPAVLGMTLYLATVGHRLLPVRDEGNTAIADGLEDCLFEMRVAAGSELDGQTIEEAELRNLGEAFLAHVRRGERVIPAGPEVELHAGDVLSFTGRASALDELLARDGLGRAITPIAPTEDRTLPLFEAVVAASSNLVDKTLREVSFRDTYGGVVLAIRRSDEQLDGALGRIRIKAGDLLIIEARDGFDRQWNAQRNEFYLVAPRSLERLPPQRRKAPIAIAILLGMVGLVAMGWMPLVTASFAAALGMVATRCIRLNEARKSVDVSVLIVIAAALGLGKAVEATGLAEVAAHALVATTANWGMVGVLVVLYLSTNVLTELITHKAAAVLMLPVALAAALELGGDPKAFAMLIAVSAAGSFMTPIGYQTNLMVMAAGGYRFTDYFKVGLPATLIVMGITVTILHVFYL